MGKLWQCWSIFLTLEKIFFFSIWRQSEIRKKYLKNSLPTWQHLQTPSDRNVTAYNWEKAATEHFPARENFFFSFSLNATCFGREKITFERDFCLIWLKKLSINKKSKFSSLDKISIVFELLEREHLVHDLFLHSLLFLAKQWRHYLVWRDVEIFKVGQCRQCCLWFSNKHFTVTCRPKCDQNYQSCALVCTMNMIF